MQVVTEVLEREGRSLCALVNNAGMTGFDRTRKLDFVGAEHFERVMSTNVFGLVRVTEAYLPLLKQTAGARIVNVGSYFGDIAPPHAYLAQYGQVPIQGCPVARPLIPRTPILVRVL